MWLSIQVGHGQTLVTGAGVMGVTTPGERP